MKVYTYKMVLVTPDKVNLATEDLIGKALRESFVGLMGREDLMEVAAKAEMVRVVEVDYPDVDASNASTFNKQSYLWRRKCSEVIQKEFE